LHNSGVDGRIRRHGQRGKQLNRFWNELGDEGGKASTHFAIGGILYGASVLRDDEHGYDAARATLQALALNGLTTAALKGIVNRDRPKSGNYSWPSGHASSTFTLATVMYDRYGPVAGVPLMTFAGFVGYQRVQSNRHYLSDVVSGALLGIVIGHATSRNMKPQVLGMDVIPMVTPEGGVGLALGKEW
jgi:hypothetical protein